MKADIGLCFVKSCFKKGFFIDPSKESYCVEDLKNSILNKISKYYLLQLSKLDRCKLAKGNNSSNTISRKKLLIHLRLFEFFQTILNYCKLIFNNKLWKNRNNHKENNF